MSLVTGSLLQVLRGAPQVRAEARTVFHGFLDEEGIRQRLAESDVFVMTSSLKACLWC